MEFTAVIVILALGIAAIQVRHYTDATANPSSKFLPVGCAFTNPGEDTYIQFALDSCLVLLFYTIEWQIQLRFRPCAQQLIQYLPATALKNSVQENGMDLVTSTLPRNAIVNYLSKNINMQSEYVVPTH